MSAIRDFSIQQGKTFSQTLRWESSPIVWKQITGISQSAPAIINVPAHGVPDGWRVEISSVKGMREINGVKTTATIVDPDTIELNSVNAADFKAYAGGGYLHYQTPVDLTGMTARMSIKNKIGGTELLRLDTTNGRITIDPVRFAITLSISATDTEAIDWKKGVYDLEIVGADGSVSTLLSGKVVVVKEVTTT